MTLTYSSYLKIPELLSLQQPASGRDGKAEHDETLFIVIHQVYELWFKQQLHECRLLQKCLESGDDPMAISTLRRMLTILKVMVSQLDVLETMTPLGFHSFRERLHSSSGFQSAQFRVFETVLGNRRETARTQFASGSAEHTAIEEAWAAPTLWQSFLRRIARSGFPVAPATMDDVRHTPCEADVSLQDILLTVYRGHPHERVLCELLVDLDEGLQEWRYRHVKMVERTIGFKTGTGGSPGVPYLRSTLFAPLFPDLWVIRTRF
ncbi:MAG: tryptophan 2,3-dioxygenase family protein [Planctomycetota bacterium]|nr:tryptophan 2,3-dioxygenase family protein [Planctomycetota bacterium]MDA1105576.1 tryptophan 2,3-dioxygenase family protein [Planctomycetota bacterium]